MNELLLSLVQPDSTGSKANYEVAIDVLNASDESVHKQLEWLTELFVEAGNNGGFSRPSVSPSQSKLTLLPKRSEVSHFFKYQLAAELVDLRAFQLLRNMCGRLTRDDIDVTRISVTELGHEEHRLIKVPEPNEQNEYDVYPEISSLVRLKIEEEELEFSKARRCLVEMFNPVDTSHVLGIADWIKPWYQLLEAGAFAMPVGLPYETDSISGSVTVFDKITVEISMDRFQASETAWNVLVNLLEAYSCILSPISKVTID